jgi:tetratricopeptide (TPR) repeat protein
VIATASELFETRHYPSVVAMCSDALEDEPECLPLLLIRARAQIALRRDLDAQADLRDIIRLDAGCSVAYRLLGELAARRDENESAALFFREALRLNPDDREAHDWLRIVHAPVRPAAGAKLPAQAAAAGRFSSTPAGQPRIVRGTHPPGGPPEERPTQPFARGQERLRAAQDYQRSMKVQLSTAIVTLGLATPQRIEWAAVSHQPQLARERHL